MPVKSIPAREELENSEYLQSNPPYALIWQTDFDKFLKENNNHL